MQLKPFLLDIWLDNYEHDIEFNLASSEGPRWTVNALLNLAGDPEQARRRLLNHALVYGRPAGASGLREAIAEMHDVSAECVQVMTGASEALVVLMWLAAEPGANVILPRPGYAPFSALPESLGIETRFYGIRKENNFSVEVEEISKLADAGTKLIVVNSPHHPTGATISDAKMDSLHEFTSARGIQLVSDEVYHPIYHGPATQSASRLPQATVIHDFSKAFALPGVRIGWMIERDPVRRERYWNARTYFSISNNSSGEMLAEIAMRQRDVVLGKTQATATLNLEHLDSFMAKHRETLAWIRPQGGMTAFPWLLSGDNARPFCQAAAEQGILLAPGDCFDSPSHFRLGFAATGNDFPLALERLGKFVKNWPAQARTRDR